MVIGKKYNNFGIMFNEEDLIKFAKWCLDKKKTYRYDVHLKRWYNMNTLKFVEWDFILDKYKKSAAYRNPLKKFKKIDLKIKIK
jgi:hypothetical protein